MLRIHFLGEPEIFVDENAIPLPTRKMKHLFAYLWLNRKQPQARERLASLFWTESSEEQARQNVRQALHQLRKALMTALQQVESHLQLTHKSAQFNPTAPCWVDAQEFELLLTRAQGFAGVERAQLLREAISLYQGEFLAGCYDNWCLEERERLADLLIKALRELIVHHAARKEYEEAIAYTKQLLLQNPLQEETHRCLIYLYYASKECNAALEHYCNYKRLLKAELKTEPLPATKALAQGIREQACPASLARLAGLGSDLLPSNLPIPLTSFIGRGKELHEIKHLLSTSRLLTLTGFGGCGKTRLALQVSTALAHEFENGAWWVELASLEDPALVAQAVASALDVREQLGQPLLETLTDHLQPKRLLLVLDNCEHLVEAAAALTDQLLKSCPDLKILTTSRETLGIAGETSWRVPPLSLPQEPVSSERLMEYDAVRLFIERAQAARRDLDATDGNAAMVAQICQRLDGIPLAIELAAARVTVLTVEQIAHRLGDRFRLLTGGSRTALPRHQTLRAAMDWSFHLLTPAERALLRRLSVFAGSFSLEAAEAVCTDELIPGPSPSELLDLLTGLVDKSLVDFTELCGAVRYRLLETVRQYSQEKLLESGESEVVRRKHRDYFLRMAEEAEPNLQNAEQAVWLNRLEMEHGNLRVALEWSLGSREGEVGLRLAGALWRFWHIHGYWNEGRRNLGDALARACNLPTAARAKALNGAGFLALLQGDLPKAHLLCQKSLVIRQQLDDKKGIAASMTNLGYVAYVQGDYPASQRLFHESLSIHRQLGNKRGIAISFHNLGNVARFQEDLAAAHCLYQESLALRRQLGDKEGTADVLNSLGRAVHEQGNYEKAHDLYEESLDLHRQLGNKRGISLSLHNLGHLARLQGDLAAARSLCQEALALRQELGDKISLAESFEDLASVECVAKQFERAARWFGAAEALREAIKTPLPPTDSADHARCVAVARASLGEEKFRESWSQGRTMRLEEVVESALRPELDSQIRPRALGRWKSSQRTSSSI